MKPLVPMRTALADPDLFGRLLGDDSWSAWRTLLIAALGEELTPDERVIFESLTGRPTEPLQRVDEFWAIIGRRGGKTRAISVAAAYFAALCDWSDILAPGERATLPIMSASMWQASRAKNYLSGAFAEVPALKRLVTNETSDTISLANSIDIECRPASFRTIRGSSAISIICDEVAFWRSDETTKNPDTEILAAARPALATTHGMLLCISSPYARRGELWNAYRRDYGPEGDAAILVAKAATRVMNPSLSEKAVQRAYERDAAAASAEYGGEFRQDLEAFVSREAVDACVEHGCYERAPLAKERYVAFVDPSGGSADAMTLAIAHREGEIAILDAVREVKPPFSPERVTAEFAALIKSYRISTVTGDRYAGEWPREQFRKHGVNYVTAERNRSELYVNLLPHLNSRRLSLLDNARLITQLVALERRTGRSGKDAIDHAPGSHDDLANAAAGALCLASLGRQRMVISDAMLAKARNPKIKVFF